MKSNCVTFLLVIAMAFIACSNNSYKNKINLKVVENNDIKLERYKISEITTIHEFIDVTNKRWNKTERIFEGNTDIIDSLYIKSDSIIITTRYKEPIIYDLASIKFGYKIAVKQE